MNAKVMSMAAGLAERPLEVEFPVELIEAREPDSVKHRSPYRRESKNSNGVTIRFCMW